jgi:hypothetical protein
MKSLNLPQYDCKVKEVDGKQYIYDAIRKKYLVLTPEEWVRQHFINLLVTQYKYPRSMFALETGHKYQTLSKRSDILIFSNTGTPFLLVECKAPEILLNQNVFNQIAQYHHTIRPTFLAVTNGLEHYCFQSSDQGVIFLDNFPVYC